MAENSSEIPITKSSLLAAVGNHEAKSLLVARMATHNRPFSQLEITREINTVADESDIFHLDYGNTTYHINSSLIPGGIVRRHETSSRMARYELSSAGKTVGAAMAGMALRWSLEFPDISVQTVLGKNIHGLPHENYTALARTAILSDLLDAGKAGVPKSVLKANHADMPDTDKVLHTARLSSLGLFLNDPEQGQIDYNPMLKVGTSSGRAPVASPSETFTAMAKIISTAAQAGTQSLRLEDLIEMVMEANPDLDAQDVRKKALITAHGKRRRLLSFVDEHKNTRQGDDILSIRPEYENALQEFVDNVFAFDSPRYRERFKKDGAEIVENKEDVNALLNKIKLFSHKKPVNGKDLLVKDVILQALASGNTLSLADIVEAVNANRVNKSSISSVRQILYRLSYSAQVDIEAVKTVNGKGLTDELATYRLRTDT